MNNKELTELKKPDGNLITKEVIEELLRIVTGQNNGDVVPLMWVEYWLLDNYGHLVHDFYQDKDELYAWIMDLLKEKPSNDDIKREVAIDCMRIVAEEDGGGEIKFVKTLGDRIRDRIAKKFLTQKETNE